MTKNSEALLLKQIADVEFGYIHQLRAGDIIATLAYLGKCYPHLANDSVMESFPFFTTLFEPIPHIKYAALDNHEPENLISVFHHELPSLEGRKPEALQPQSFLFAGAQGERCELPGRQDLFENCLVSKVFFLRIKAEFKDHFIPEYIQLGINEYVDKTDSIVKVFDGPEIDSDFWHIMNECKINNVSISEQAKILQRAKDEATSNAKFLPPWNVLVDTFEKLGALIELLSHEKVNFNDLYALTQELMQESWRGLPKEFNMPEHLTLLVRLVTVLDGFLRNIYPLYLSGSGLEEYSKNPRMAGDMMLESFARHNNARKPGQPLLSITSECLSSINKDAGDLTDDFKGDMYIKAHQAYDEFEKFLWERCPYEQHDLLRLPQFRPLIRISYFELICIARLRRLLVDKNSVFEAAKKSIERAINDKLDAEKRADKTDNLLISAVKNLKDMLLLPRSELSDQARKAVDFTLSQLQEDHDLIKEVKNTPPGVPGRPEKVDLRTANKWKKRWDQYAPAKGRKTKQAFVEHWNHNKREDEVDLTEEFLKSCLEKVKNARRS